MGEVEIRRADVEDAGAIAALRTVWHPPADGADPGDFAGHVRAWMLGEGDARAFWLALGADGPVGMVTLLEYRRMPSPGRPPSRWGHVGHLYVLPAHRRRGVATRLLAAVTDESAARGQVRLVTSPSPEAEALFAAAGFGPAGTRLRVRPAPT